MSSAVGTIITTGSFGATRKTDAYLIALAIPTMLVVILSLAPSLAAIPDLVRERSERGDGSAQILAATLVWGIALVVAPCLLLLVLARSLVVPLVAPGFEAGDRELTASLMLITVPAALCIAISNGLTAVLNARDRYVIAAVAPTIVNVAVGTVVIVFARQSGVVSWAIGYLVGSIVVLLVLLLATRAAGQRTWWAANFRHPAMLGLVATVVPFVALAGVGQVSQVVIRVVTSLLPGGAITALSIALTITNIPLGLSAYALGTTLVPAFARYLAEDPSQVQLLFVRGVRLLMVALAPVAALLVVLSHPLVRALFERGSFDARATTVTSEALQLYALSLLAQPFFVVAHRALLGARATHVLLILGVAETTALAVLTFALGSAFGHVGVAAGYSTSIAISAALLTAASARYFGRPDIGRSLVFGAVTIGLAMVASLAAVLVLTVVPSNTDRVAEFSVTVAAGVVGIGTYVALLWFVPLPAIRELRMLMAGRMSRPA